MQYTLTIYVILILTISFSSNRIQAQDDFDNISAGTIATDYFGIEMVYVPSGTVQMGIDIDVFSELVTTGIFADFGGRSLVVLQKDSGVFETYETTVQGFWIDKYEVTVDSYERIAQQCLSTDTCSGSYLPQLVTWNEAVGFCANRGARLPTEREWEYAASGSDDLIFPWGNQLRTSLVDYEDYLGFELYDVGSRPLNVSWAGIFDMAGNADEWTDSLFQPYYSWDETKFTNWHEVHTEYSRVLRGGKAVDSFLRKTTYSRQGGFSGAAGFRCVRFSNPNGA